MNSRKVAAIWISLVIIFSLIVIIVEIAPRVVAPTTLYVGGGGGGNYSKIQWAIDNASNGDTVFVYNGTYYENVVVNKTISLVGEGRNNTIINANSNEDPVKITVDWVNITGFTLTACGGGWNNGGIVLYKVDNCKITDNNVSQNNNHGINIFYSDTNNLSNNHLTKNEIGIYLFRSHGNTLLSNSLTQDGIVIEGVFDAWNSHFIDSSNKVNQKPVIYLKNQTGGSVLVDAGQIILANCSDILIEGQNLTNGCIGIQMGYSSNNNISGNILGNNSKYGIILYFSNGNWIENNTMLKSIYGIYLLYSNGNTIINNNCSYNEDGIRGSSSNGNNISHNTVLFNYYAINLWGCQNNSINNNSVFNNNFGIYLPSNSNRNNLIGNNVSFNIGSGIGFGNSYGNDIIGNKVFSNGAYGISISSTLKGNQVVGNLISFNYFAIYISDSMGIMLSENIMEKNGIYVTGSSIEHLNSNNIDTLNMVNGMPVYYWKNQTGGVIPSYAGQVMLVNCTNIRIENQKLINCSISILLAYSSNCTIINNNVSNNKYFGIYLVNSDNNTISGNNVSNCKRGIFCYNSPKNNILYNNIFGNNEYGIYALYGGGLNITGNNVSNNRLDGIHLRSDPGSNITDNVINENVDYGIYLFFSEWCNITDNNASYNGREGIYLTNSDLCNIINNQVSYNKGNGIVPSYSDNCLLFGNNASGNSRVGIKPYSSDRNNVFNNKAFQNGEQGIGIYFSIGSNITDNTALSNNNHGLSLFNSGGTNITDNDLWLNHQGGIAISLSDGNSIKSNNILSNYWEGINLVNSHYNDIIANNISNNKLDGLRLGNSNDNYIARNTLSQNLWDGVDLSFTDSNDIIENTIFSSGSYGLNLMGCTNNSIYHNYILNNTNQAYDDGINQWDAGYPSGGNYWSDYIGVDLNSTPNQDVPPSDGIGDTPYLVDSDSLDNYPLMEPYIPTQLENYTILNKGWNLISIPLIQDNKNLTKVLEMIDGYYDAVQWYNITDPDDPWKHNKIGKPYGNDLSNLNETMSFWIHITQPGDTIFLYNGTQPTSNQTILLHPGWNMVGYPSLTSHNRTVGLNNLKFGPDIDVIQWFNASTKTWHFMGPDDTFELGRGYWVHSKVTKTWDVPL